MCQLHRRLKKTKAKAKAVICHGTWFYGKQRSREMPILFRKASVPNAVTGDWKRCNCIKKEAWRLAMFFGKEQCVSRGRVG